MEQSTFKCWLFCRLPLLKIGVVWGSFPLPLHSCSGHAVGALWRHKGLMPPSCGLLEPGGWSVPAAVFQNQPLLCAGMGLWAWGAAGVKVRGFCLTSAEQHGSPACKRLQAAFVGPAGLCKNPSFLNLFLEKPFCYLNLVLCAFWCLFITLERNAVKLTFDSLVFLFHCCISVASVFLFWAETLFPVLCGLGPSLCAQ